MGSLELLWSKMEFSQDSWVTRANDAESCSHFTLGFEHLLWE